MFPSLFAGAVISTELYYTLIAGALVVVIAGLTLVVFIIKKIGSSKKSSNDKQTFKKSLLLSTIAVLALATIFLIIPTIINDAQTEHKRSDCTDKTGYEPSDPDNYNPDIATPDSYFAYRECLEN